MKSIIRNLFVIAACAVCLSIAACGQNPKPDGVTIKGQNGSVTISANGQNFSMKASDDKSGSFTMSGNGGHFVMKASDGKQTVDINASGGHADLDLPGFVTTYRGARLQSTTINAGAKSNSGTFAFETSDSPAAVIAWYKQKATGAGLARAVNMNMGPTMVFTANADGGKKVLQVIAANSGSGAHVQVNWSGGT
ncbi:MAG TPA: hypothetical protein VHX61_13780 [Rhizomicrobium sp.]|jgi:hypothetical protein|nr:hypothetical protein [Rhizomicrobium sp.]